MLFSAQTVEILNEKLVFANCCLRATNQLFDRFLAYMLFVQAVLVSGILVGPTIRCSVPISSTHLLFFHYLGY
jgi:hypothetical protein